MNPTYPKAYEMEHATASCTLSIIVVVLIPRSLGLVVNAIGIHVMSSSTGHRERKEQPLDLIIRVEILQNKFHLLFRVDFRAMGLESTFSICECFVREDLRLLVMKR